MTTNDDKSWRRKTLYGIYRRIITDMRRPDIVQQIRSLGLLAYAKTFEEIWIEKYPNDKGSAEIPIFYKDHMEESIRASETRIRFENQQKAERSNTFRSVVFWMAGFVVSVVGLVKLSEPFKIQEQPNWLLAKLATKMLTEPYWILVGAVALYAARALWHRVLNPQRWSIVRAFQAVLTPLDRKYAALAFWFLGAALVWTGYLLSRF